MKRRLADWLCRAASWLRGEQWYISGEWYAAPGNRVADLRQRIWADVVFISWPYSDEDKLAMERIERDLAELAQAAGESWGHVWPKEIQPGGKE